MDAALFMNSLQAIIQSTAATGVSRPSFDGTGALKFLQQFENYVVIEMSNKQRKNKLNELLKCITDPRIAERVRRGCVQTDARGNLVALGWDDSLAWFKEEFQVQDDATLQLETDESSLSSRSSFMGPRESMTSYITRFNDLIFNVNHSRNVWNSMNSNIADSKKYKDITEVQKIRLFLDRVNEYHFEIANKHSPERSTWDVILSEVKKNDLVRLKRERRFRGPLRAPTETLNTSVPVTAQRPPPGTPVGISEAARLLLHEKDKALAAAQKALEKEKRQHSLTREQAVKNKSFPVNSISQGDSTSPRAPPQILACYLCHENGHQASSCPANICERCRGPHKKIDCPQKVVDAWCTLCTTLGHVVEVCPYALIGRLPFMQVKTRKQATIDYRARMATRAKDKVKRKGGPTSKQNVPCNNWKAGRTCAYDPCMFLHDTPKPAMLPGTAPRKPRRPPKSRSRSPDRHRNRSHSRARGRRQRRSRSLSPRSRRQPLNQADYSRRSPSPPPLHSSRSRGHYRSSRRSRSPDPRSRGQLQKRPRHGRSPPNYATEDDFGIGGGLAYRANVNNAPLRHPDREQYVKITKDAYHALVSDQVQKEAMVAAASYHNGPNPNDGGTSTLLDAVLHESKEKSG